MTESRIAVTRELPLVRHAVRIEPPNGAPSRWAADEHLAENVIQDLKWSGELNGGAKEATGTLARNPRVSWPDLGAFSEFVIYGPGADELWRGRLDKASESDGDRMSIDASAVGHKAALEDIKGIVLGFIDGDLGKWNGPSTQRKRDGLEKYGWGWTNGNLSQGFQDKGAAVPSLLFEFSEWSSSVAEVIEAWYYGGGVDIGSVLYDFIVPRAGGTDSINNQMYVATDDEAHGATEGVNHKRTAVSQQARVAPGPSFKYALFQSAMLLAELTGISGGDTYGVANPKVIGSQGLTLQGTWPDIGFTAKQMIASAVSQFTYLEVDEDGLEDDGFVIPQAWFSDPTTMLAVVEELTKYGLLDWFVRGRKFHLRFPGTYGRRWQAYAGPSELKEQGLDASRLWRSIVVRYQDVDGSTRSVGPPGSGAMVEDAGLEIIDPDHPAVRAGLTRQDILDLGGIATQAQAIATGERWLEQANLLSRSGSCTLTYYVMDDRGVLWPTSKVQEGDEVRFPDAHDTSYRRIVAYEYTDASKSSSVTLDAPKESITALLERFNAKLNARGIA